MRADDFVHIVNPNKKNFWAVSNFFEKNPMLRAIFIERTSHPTHLETVVEWAINEGSRRLAVWGGDGTLSRVAQKLYEMNMLAVTTVALVPVGTCNDFARALKLPSWKQCASGMLQGAAKEYSIDIGLLSFTSERQRRQRVFVNNAGFGRQAAALQKHASNPIKDILSFDSTRVDLDWTLNESQSFETCDLLLGVICNGPFFSNGLHFDSDISISDGILNVCLEKPQSKLKLLAKFLKARFGASLRDSNTLCVPANELVVQADRLLYPQADGEPVDVNGVIKIKFSILSKAARIAQWAFV
jgi:diacylglycerol kinase family enzyme